MVNCKTNSKIKAEEIFEESDVNITEDGKKHLGASIGSQKFKSNYLDGKVNEWIKELKVLSQIAKSQPQSAYSCFITGFKHKVTYYMRTTDGAMDHLKRLDEEIQT